MSGKLSRRSIGVTLPGHGACSPRLEPAILPTGDDWQYWLFWPAAL
jgi:hypothetical protein